LITHVTGKQISVISREGGSIETFLKKQGQENAKQLRGESCIIGIYPTLTTLVRPHPILTLRERGQIKGGLEGELNFGIYVACELGD